MFLYFIVFFVYLVLSIARHSQAMSFATDQSFMSQYIMHVYEITTLEINSGCGVRSRPVLRNRFLLFFLYLYIFCLYFVIFPVFTHLFYLFCYFFYICISFVFILLFFLYLFIFCLYFVIFPVFIHLFSLFCYFSYIYLSFVFIYLLSLFIFVQTRCNNIKLARTQTQINRVFGFTKFALLYTKLLFVLHFNLLECSLIVYVTLLIENLFLCALVLSLFILKPPTCYRTIQLTRRS